MPAKKPSLQEVMEAIQTLNVGMGAELVSLRAEVEKQNLTITGLSHMLASVVSIVDTQTLAGKYAKSFVQPMPPGAMPLFHEAVDPIYTADQIYGGCYPLNAEEKALAANGSKIDAIKAYRGRINGLTGTMPGLKESKDLVCAYADEHAASKPHFDPSSPPPLLNHHKQLVKEGKKIDAIKLYREYTMKMCTGYAGLKESKDIIDAYAWSIGMSNFGPQISFVNQPW
jgi:ribosomal protein L7/L12